MNVVMLDVIKLTGVWRFQPMMTAESFVIKDVISKKVH